MVLWQKSILNKDEMISLGQVLFNNCKSDIVDEDEFIEYLESLGLSSEEINKLLPPEIFIENLACIANQIKKDS
jgi:hypothetical protein